MTRSCLVLAAAATLLSAGAFAQDAAPTAAPEAAPAAQSPDAQNNAFMQLDQDKSGSISMSEAEAAPVVQRSFTTADKDHDGSISQEEFNSAFTIASPPPQAAGEESGTPPTSPPQ